MYKFLPNCTNSSPKCAKMSQFPAMARQKSKFFLAGTALAGKNYNFGPEDSCPAPPRPDLTCQTLSRQTKRYGLGLSNEAGFFFRKLVESCLTDPLRLRIRAWAPISEIRRSRIDPSIGQLVWSPFFQSGFKNQPCQADNRSHWVTGNWSSTIGATNH